MKSILLAALLFLPASAQAQEPVSKWADGVSWGTALANPIHAAVEALKSDHKACELGRLALSEAIVNATVITLKHFVVSPRPCMDFGCQPDGFPSGHSANSVVGAGGWSYGIVFSASTATLRMEAHRHTPWQVAAGLAIGAGGELAGRLVKCP